MNTVLYVVFSEQGSYSDYTKDNVCVCSSEEDARNVIKNMGVVSEFNKRAHEELKSALTAWERDPNNKNKSRDARVSYMNKVIREIRATFPKELDFAPYSGYACVAEYYYPNHDLQYDYEQLPVIGL